VIDFHTHSLFSDGELVPSELVRRAYVKGYRAIGLTDHVDGSNLDLVAPRLRKAAAELNRLQPVLVIPGVEITHAPIEQIRDLVARSLDLGSVLVVVHGESPVEPVAPGTNLAAIEAGADVLAHPGFITVEEARFAAEKGTRLEITSRAGHCLTNGHVARTALEVGATLVVNTDTHSPEDLITRERAFQILSGAGLSEIEAQRVLANNEEFMTELRRRLRLN
jgi:putative hydrolase